MIKFGRDQRGWVRYLNSHLRRQTELGLKVLDLFCGAGGFSLGFWASGFDVVGIDRDADASRTYMSNIGHANIADIRDVSEFPDADVLIAGPPCQPWSRAGKRLGEQDDRDGLSTVLQVAKNVSPAVVVIENVPDIGRGGKRQYLDEFELQLRALGYQVAEHLLNASDYGVPQHRRRLFVTGIRDHAPLVSPPHMSWTVTVKQAIPGRCKRSVSGSHMVSESMDAYIEKYERASGCRVPRDVHTDRPSRTLTVRNLSGATGDMLRLRLPDGQRRTLTVQEAARLQSFPDWFRFQGTERSRFEQIGNAVPPLLSIAIANVVRERLVGSNWRDLIPNSYPLPSNSAASATMRANRRRDTAPEKRLRSALHRMGWRFRVDFPIQAGERRVRPDIVFTRTRVAIFIDGCFWHSCPEHAQQPKSNAQYWESKLRRNVERDLQDTLSLERAGWDVVRIWEHEPIDKAVSAIQTILASR